MTDLTKETEKSATEMFLYGLKPIWPNLVKREYPRTYEYFAHMRRANRMLCECTRDGYTEYKLFDRAFHW